MSESPFLWCWDCILKVRSEDAVEGILAPECPSCGEVLMTEPPPPGTLFNLLTAEMRKAAQAQQDEWVRTENQRLPDEDARNGSLA